MATPSDDSLCFFPMLSSFCFFISYTARFDALKSRNHGIVTIILLNLLPNKIYNGNLLVYLSVQHRPETVNAG